MKMKKKLWEITWHWLQAFSIILLLFTGFQMHYPDILIVLWNLSTSVNIHLICGAILLINSFFGLFYHLTTGIIAHFIPGKADIPYGVMKQTHYYLCGIFHKAPSPFKTDEHNRFNPLQRIAYFSLLTLLLPFQLMSGTLLYCIGQWPILFDHLWGLKHIASIHTLTAFLFLSFLIVHLYLSTTSDTAHSLLEKISLAIPFINLP